MPARPPPAAPRTSETDPIEVAIIDTSRPGSVALTFAPGKHGSSAYAERGWARDLEQDLERLAGHHGAGLLVCLLEDQELASLAIPDLVARAARRMRVLRLPIRDGGVPPEVARVEALVTAIDEAARAGTNVVIHCRGGLGRAGVVGGCYLAHIGLDPDEIFARLRRRHPTSCPETDGQRAFIRAFAASARGR